MSRYSEMVQKVLGKYEKPRIEDVTLGFSGIDPQRKYKESDSQDDHELLHNLKGGDENGYYHLTLAELEFLRVLREALAPQILEGQEITINAGEEMEGYQVIIL